MINYILQVAVGLFNSFCQGTFSLHKELSADGMGCSGTTEPNLPVSLKLVEKSLDGLL